MENLKKHTGKRSEGENIVLKCILQDRDIKTQFLFAWFRVGCSGGYCKHGNKASGYIKD
jgi:hypothetical protein